MAYLISDRFYEWRNNCIKEKHSELEREEEINSIIADFYKTDLSISDNNESGIIVPNKKEAVISLLSYAVGCIFGRYNPDTEGGIVFAGGDFEKSLYKYDNCRFKPIRDNAATPKMLTELLTDFISSVYGKETLDENISFISLALSGDKSGQADVITDYFAKNFYKDHLKAYKNTPIYIKLSSGKEFICFFYLHRYNKKTIDCIKRLVYESIPANSELNDFYSSLCSIVNYDIKLEDGVKYNLHKISTDINGESLKLFQ